MLQKIKISALSILSYFKPVDLGLHTTDQNALKDEPVKADAITKIIEYEVNKAIANKIKHKFTTINIDEDLNTKLNPNLGAFKVMSISIADKPNYSIIKLKHIKTGRIVRISLNTFRLFFDSARIL